MDTLIGFQLVSYQNCFVQEFGAYGTFISDCTSTFTSVEYYVPGYYISSSYTVTYDDYSNFFNQTGFGIHGFVLPWQSVDKYVLDTETQDLGTLELMPEFGFPPSSTEFTHGGIDYKIRLCVGYSPTTNPVDPGAFGNSVNIYFGIGVDAFGTDSAPQATDPERQWLYHGRPSLYGSNNDNQYTDSQVPLTSSGSNLLVNSWDPKNPNNKNNKGEKGDKAFTKIVITGKDRNKNEQRFEYFFDKADEVNIHKPRFPDADCISFKFPVVEKQSGSTASITNDAARSFAADWNNLEYFKASSSTWETGILTNEPKIVSNPTDKINYIKNNFPKSWVSDKGIGKSHLSGKCNVRYGLDPAGTTGQHQVVTNSVAIPVHNWNGVQGGLQLARGQKLYKQISVSNRTFLGKIVGVSGKNEHLDRKASTCIIYLDTAVTLSSFQELFVEAPTQSEAQTRVMFVHPEDQTDNFAGLYSLLEINESYTVGKLHDQSDDQWFIYELDFKNGMESEELASKPTNRIKQLSANKSTYPGQAIDLGYKQTQPHFRDLTFVTFQTAALSSNANNQQNYIRLQEMENMYQRPKVDTDGDVSSIGGGLDRPIRNLHESTRGNYGWGPSSNTGNSLDRSFDFVVKNDYPWHAPAGMWRNTEWILPNPVDFVLRYQDFKFTGNMDLTTFNNIDGNGLEDVKSDTRVYIWNATKQTEANVPSDQRINTDNPLFNLYNCKVEIQ